MRKYDNQEGRSMIEMLGVLAIVGVLSVAGIAGYSKAMGKYKVNKVMDQVSTLAANIKTMFASTGSYADLKAGTGEGATSTGVAESLGLIPEEMTKGDTVRNGLNGLTKVGPTVDSGTYGLGFYIRMDGITKEACTTLITSDWGGSAGFRYLTFTAGTAQTAATAAEGSVTFAVASSGNVVTPATTQANLFSSAENCGADNVVTWVFY